MIDLIILEIYQIYREYNNKNMGIICNISTPISMGVFYSCFDLKYVC